MNRGLDIFFVVLHTSVMAFNLFGWIPKKTRKANLTLLLLTGIFWAVIGPVFFAFGYCPLTDWHWDVLREMGVKDLPNSYVKYLADRLTGLDFDAKLVDIFTGISYLTALLVSVTINSRDFIRKRKKR